MNIEDLLTVGEIDRLKEENEFFRRTDEEIYQEAEDNIRANIISFGTPFNFPDDPIHRKAMEEFVEILKRKSSNYYPSIDQYCCSVKAVNANDIDELLKEYDK